MRLCPKKLKGALPALPFFSPYLLHDVIRNVSRWFRQGNCRDPSLQRRRENATGNQALLLFGPVVCTAGNDSRHRLVAVANQHFFAVLYEPDVSAEMRFQIANVYGTHTHITTNLTMLVISSVGIPLRKTRSLDCSVETRFTFHPANWAVFLGKHKVLSRFFSPNGVKSP